MNAINFKLLTVSTVVFLLLCYFSYHALNGERGVFAYLRLTKELTDLQNQYDTVKSQRETLESRINRLHPKTLDTDLLDEISRKDLGLVGENDKVIYLK